MYSLLHLSTDSKAESFSLLHQAHDRLHFLSAGSFVSLRKCILSRSVALNPT
jgi:hypothetical protein